MFGTLSQSMRRLSTPAEKCVHDCVRFTLLLETPFKVCVCVLCKSALHDLLIEKWCGMRMRVRQFLNTSRVWRGVESSVTLVQRGVFQLYLNVYLQNGL